MDSTTSDLKEGSTLTNETRVIRIRTLNELDDLEGDWKKLEQFKEGPSIFQSWLWNRTWCQEVLPTRKGASLDVRVVEDGAGRILAILPFFEEPVVGPFARVTQFLGPQMSFHNDVLLGDPSSVEHARIVVSVLPKDISSRGVLHLRHLDHESVFTKELLAKGTAEPMCSRLQIMHDPSIKDQYARLGSSSRKNLRWKANKLRRQFGIDFRICTGTEFPEAFDELIKLHRQRKAQVGSSTLLEGANCSFLKMATTLLSNLGAFEIVQLRAGDKTIAAALMAVDKRRYFSYQSGFDPEFAGFSPMAILLTETMRRGFEDLGCEVYDFGPGDQDYKFDWAPHKNTNYMSCYGGSGFYSKTVAAVYGGLFMRRMQAIQSVKPPVGSQ